MNSDNLVSIDEIVLPADQSILNKIFRDYTVSYFMSFLRIAKENVTLNQIEKVLVEIFKLGSPQILYA